jgi:predicted peptidase
MNYLIHVPIEYQEDKGKKWPLLVFLHGAGEKGTTVNLVMKHGLPKIVMSQPSFPFILLSPQCPFGRYTWIAEDVISLIQEIASEYNVDQKRIYLTGMSMGGYGCWSLAAAYPEVFAAVAPLCGGGDDVDVVWGSREKPEAFMSLPIWAFHGAKDRTVPLSESQDMVNAFKKAGCTEIQLTVYPEAGHDCWTETYKNPELYTWLLRHRRN